MSLVTLTVNPTIDMNCSVERVEPDVKLRTGPLRFEPGGGGINVCRAVRELGGDATALWTKGGHSGETLDGLLNELGFTHESIPMDGDSRQNLNVSEGSSDRQFRFVAPGPQADDDTIERCLNVVARATQDAEFLVLSGGLLPGLPDDFYADVARSCPSTCRVIVDTSGTALRQAVTAGVFLITPNLRELSQLTGRPLEDDDEIVAAARDVVGTGKAEAVVVSLGAGGAVLVTDDTTELVRSPTVPVRSRIGAGDSMTGGLALALTRGDSLSNAVRFGVAAGAAAVMTEGTMLCRRNDTERLFQQLVSDSNR